MAGHGETLDEHRSAVTVERPGAIVGLLIVFTEGHPAHVALPLDGDMLEIGRGSIQGIALTDPSISRHHARVVYDGVRWSVEDQGSRNGTSVDGQEVRGCVAFTQPRVLRLGKTLLLFSADLSASLRGDVVLEEECVVGPTLRTALEAIARAARSGDDALHMTGESGSGKELAARAFHAAGPRAAGPFVAVNCATIPHGVAERLLFGAKKGAYSGAVADADGYAQAADGGTLFFDEVAELDPTVQAKLLRMLETHEVLQLGAARPRPVDLRICSATHRSLRAEVAAGRFREDLYFRMGRPEVRIPPLRERLEEVPWLIAREIARVGGGLVPHFSLVESCLGRPWPGNVRELLVEVRGAAQAAIAAQRTAVAASDLAPSAGQHFERATADAASHLATTLRSGPGRLQIEAALREAGGKVASAARALGMHRNQLRRWLARNQVDPRTFADGQAGDPEN